VVGVLSAIVYLAGALGRLWGFLGDILLILFFAWLVGSVLIHVVNSLMRIPHMNRPLAIVLVYIGLITLIADFALIVIPATIEQVRELANQLPALVERLPDVLARADEILAGVGINANLAETIQIQSFADAATQVQRWLTTNAIPILSNIASAVFSVGLVVVISFYIVLDGGRRLHEALKVLPPRAEAETRFVLTTIDETFHGYVRGMLVVSAIYGVGTASVMIATGLPAALPAAILSSLLLAVPFIGDQLALVLPLTIAAIAGDFITFLIVLFVLLFIQQVMLNLLTPRILGHAVRMPAMLVVISVVLGARLAGIAGALLGVPTMGVIYTLAVHYGTRIRQRRETREALARERREAEEREDFAVEVERALQRRAPSDG
jgi:predicted PurR-regulated permease PerM